MSKQSWELLSEGWRRYEVSLGRKAVSKAHFAEQISVNPKVFRDWFLRPTRNKDSIPIKYIGVVGKALRMSQEDIDAVIAARIKERAQEANDLDYAVIQGYVGRTRRVAVAKALGSADARRVLDIFRRAESLYDASLCQDMEETVALFTAFEEAFRRSASFDDEERIADSAREDVLSDTERQARIDKRQRVLEMLKERSKERMGTPSPALRERQQASEEVKKIREGKLPSVSGSD